MNEIRKYSWQSFTKENSAKRQWLTDVHAFDSLEDALSIGLEDHAACSIHAGHRIVCLVFNAMTTEYLGQTIVFYLLKPSEGETNANISDNVL